MKQILVNLLNNAVKFTPQGGALGLEMNNDPDTGMVRFIVWDTGIGIAEEDISRIFQPFVQLDPSLTRKYEGSGLGLALVRHLVEMHGGTVAVESVIGEGSRFTISLPWHAPAPATHDEETSSHLPDAELPEVTHMRPSDSPMILIAEDNVINRQAICDLLASEGYATIQAQDGVTAIITARQRRPDLILMDIQMPGMDGLEATQRIRADADLHDIPIIAVTALAMHGDRERCLEAGANAYISKPMDAQELLDAIESILKHSPKHGP